MSSATNAGVIRVGPLDHMTFADFEEAIAVMRRQGSGRIVNVSSRGGKIGVLAVIANTLAPELVATAMALANRLVLPEPSEEAGTQAQRLAEPLDVDDVTPHEADGTSGLPEQRSPRGGPQPVPRPEFCSKPDTMTLMAMALGAALVPAVSSKW